MFIKPNDGVSGSVRRRHKSLASSRVAVAYATIVAMSDTPPLGATPIPFLTDRPSLLRCVRAFVELLTLRVEGGTVEEPGCDYPLPGGLTLDGVASSLIAHAQEEDEMVVQFGLGPDTEEDDLQEIVDCIKKMIRDAPGESASTN